MMKIFRRIFVFLLVALLLTPAAFASYRHWNHGNHAHNCSDWAKAEVLQAEEMGLLSGSLPEDYRTPITRIDFCRMALCYAAIQSNMDYDTFCAAAQSKLPCGADGKVLYAFTDCGSGENALTATIAKELGIVNGKEAGRFDPQGSITRQEAAVMLTRACKATGNSLSEAGAGAGLSAYFTDSDAAASWAKDSIAAVANIQVMNGVGGGCFAPHGSYSVEQSAATFLRLCRHHENHHREAGQDTAASNYGDSWNTTATDVSYCPYGTPNCSGDCAGCRGYDENGTAGSYCPYGTPNCNGDCLNCSENGTAGGNGCGWHHGASGYTGGYGHHGQSHHHG